jgi:hypothetical protein
MFLDSFPSVDWTSVSHQNSVLRVECGQGGGIAVVVGLVSFLGERIKHLT